MLKSWSDFVGNVVSLWMFLVWSCWQPKKRKTSLTNCLTYEKYSKISFHNKKTTTMAKLLVVVVRTNKLVITKFLDKNGESIWLQLHGRKIVSSI